MPTDARDAAGKSWLELDLEDDCDEELEYEIDDARIPSALRHRFTPYLIQLASQRAVRGPESPFQHAVFDEVEFAAQCREAGSGRPREVGQGQAQHACRPVREGFPFQGMVDVGERPRRMPPPCKQPIRRGDEAPMDQIVFFVPYSSTVGGQHPGNNIAVAQNARRFVRPDQNMRDGMRPILVGLGDRAGAGVHQVEVVPCPGRYGLRCLTDMLPDDPVRPDVAINTGGLKPIARCFVVVCLCPHTLYIPKSVPAPIPSPPPGDSHIEFR